jgi:hypothetical protein
MSRFMFITMLLFAIGIACLFGCDENAFIGDRAPNKLPSVRLTGGPPEADTTSYRIKFSWMGYDPDGRIDHYEFVICDGDLTGFDPADTTGIDKWRRTMLTDSTFSFVADEGDGGTVNIGAYAYSTFCNRVHTFFIRAVDDRGARSTAAYRSFTARTLAPYVVIVAPRNPIPGYEQPLPPLVKFLWRGEDPIDEAWNLQQPESIRYLLTRKTADIMDRLNKSPEEFESLWCPWKAYDAAGDSGVSTVIGDDELLNMSIGYVFAVQAKDEAGAITSVFNSAENVRLFRPYKAPGPLLHVSEPNLGSWTVIGANNRTVTARIPAGFVLNFNWWADASSYGGVVSTYQYGWDMADLSDPDEWDVVASPFVTTTPPTSFGTGIHMLYIKVTDNMDSVTLFSIEVTVFPLSMRRNLIWVDDFYSINFAQTNYAFPTESEHTDFWLNVCSRAEGFDPGRDVFVTASRGYIPPDIELLWDYKNIIWTFTSNDEVMAWDNMVRFTPESLVWRYGPGPFDYLLSYMASGGHIWTEGKSDERGGLGAILFASVLSFPINLRCETAGIRTGCDGDTSGVNSIAYKAYCVTVLDKVKGILRDGDTRLPERKDQYDALAYAYKDAADPITAAHPELPEKLQLWGTVTRDSMFFDPKIRGFTYVELYDTAYWMRIIGAKRQPCLHPMYRMRARNSFYSPVDGDICAFWTTKYANVVANAPGTVAAPSVHFGFPLWFFSRPQVNAVADVIFDVWNIGAEQP